MKENIENIITENITYDSIDTTLLKELDRYITNK